MKERILEILKGRSEGLNECDLLLSLLNSSDILIVDLIHRIKDFGDFRDSYLAALEELIFEDRIGGIITYDCKKNTEVRLFHIVDGNIN